MSVVATRRVLAYAPLLAVASAMLFARTILYARIFPVGDFGLLHQAFLVANTFTTFAGLGLTILAQKMLPQYHAPEHRKAFDDLVSACIAVCAVSGGAAVAGLAISILAGWVRNWMTFSAALVYAVAQYLFVLHLIVLKSELRFLGYARLAGIRGVALLGAGTLAAAWSRNVTITVAVEAFMTLLVSVPYLVDERGRRYIRRAIDTLTQLRRLARFYPAAARLLWLNGTIVILYSIDRWFGIAFLSNHDYGIFALGLTVVLLFETAQAIVNVSAFPLMGRMLARGEARRAFRFATLGTLVVVACGTVLGIPFLLLLDQLLRAYLPAYVGAELVIELAFVAGVFRLADFYASLAILLDQEARLATGSGAILATAILALGMAGAAGLEFDPERMIGMTMVIAIASFILNLAIARRGYRVASRRERGSRNPGEDPNVGVP